MSSAGKRSFIWDIAWAVLFVACLLFIWWKCRYGFGNMDESFYLAIPYRLCQGDGLFIHEWHLSQMSAFLLYPLMKLYLALGGSVEGIILNFRHIYVVVQALASAFIYIRLRKISRPGAAVSSIAFMLYAPFAIMALSYNSMGIIALSVSLVILLTAQKLYWLQMIFSGLFFAAAVLCNPYLLVVYILYVIAVIIFNIIRAQRFKNNKSYRREGGHIWDISSALFFTAGAAVLAIIFAAFVLSRASVSDILRAFPNIMNDSSHEMRGIAELFVSYFRAILSISRKADACYAAMLIIAVIAVIDRKNEGHRKIWFILSALSGILALIFTAVYGRYINYLMFPLNILAIDCLAIDFTDVTKRIFTHVWIPGMIYTFCIHVSSNQEFYAISSAACVALIGTIMLALVTLRDVAGTCSLGWKMCVAAASALLVLSQLGTEAVLRYTSVFWENMKILKDYVQTSGPEKGLYISGAAEKQYKMMTDLADHINSTYSGKENVVFISMNVPMYLMCSDMRCASFSAWISEVEGNIAPYAIDKQMTYYELNPDKVPDLVCFDSAFTGYADSYRTLDDYREELYAGEFLILYR